MRIRSLLALAALAISFALPTFAQQKNTTDQRIVQQRDLLGVAKALDEFGKQIERCVIASFRIVAA